MNSRLYIRTQLASAIVSYRWSGGIPQRITNSKRLQQWREVVWTWNSVQGNPFRIERLHIHGFICSTPILMALSTTKSYIPVFHGGPQVRVSLVHLITKEVLPFFITPLSSNDWRIDGACFRVLGCALLFQIFKPCYYLLNQLRDYLTSSMVIFVMLECLRLNDDRGSWIDLYPSMLLNVTFLLMMGEFDKDPSISESVDQRINAIWVMVPSASVHIWTVL